MDSLKMLNKYAAEATALKDLIDETENSLKAMKAKLKQITDRRMLDLMMDNGLSKLEHEEITFAVKDYASGTWPKDDMLADEAAKHLAEIGGAHLLKTTLTCTFPKAHYALALEMKEVAERKRVNHNLKKTVHPMSLRAFALKVLRDGDHIDPNVLGLRIGQTVTTRRR